MVMSTKISFNMALYKVVPQGAIHREVGKFITPRTLGFMVDIYIYL
jgi:hypothetical protein